MGRKITKYESERHREFWLARRWAVSRQKVTLEDYQQLIMQMRKANVQFQQMCNIPSGELTTLLTLRHLLLAKEFVIPSDIGDAMKLSRPAVSRMLHNLERKGYLEMKSSEEDHRYVKVQFTQTGKELITEELKNAVSS